MKRIFTGRVSRDPEQKRSSGSVYVVCCIIVALAIAWMITFSMRFFAPELVWNAGSNIYRLSCNQVKVDGKELFICVKKEDKGK